MVTSPRVPTETDNRFLILAIWHNRVHIAFNGDGRRVLIWMDEGSRNYSSLVQFRWKSWQLDWWYGTESWDLTHNCIYWHKKCRRDTEELCHCMLQPLAITLIQYTLISDFIQLVHLWKIAPLVKNTFETETFKRMGDWHDFVA